MVSVRVWTGAGRLRVYRLQWTDEGWVWHACPEDC
jgi:hypothetical protein